VAPKKKKEERTHSAQEAGVLGQRKLVAKYLARIRGRGWPWWLGLFLQRRARGQQGRKIYFKNRIERDLAAP
jgi:hypothetical protein